MTTVSARPQRLTSSRPWTLVGLVSTAVVIVAGNVGVNHAAGEPGGMPDALFTGVACLALGGLLFVLVLPRVRRPERAAVALGVLAVLSLVVFWSGIPAVLGSAAAAAGQHSDSRWSRLGAWAGIGAMGVAVAWSLLQKLL